MDYTTYNMETLSQHDPEHLWQMVLVNMCHCGKTTTTSHSHVIKSSYFLFLKFCNIIYS